jgi:two-component system response regulator FixJ
VLILLRRIICIEVQIEVAMSEVFIVDDDPSVRSALSIVLNAEGFTTTGFADGESFLVEARARTPACVLIDVHLPGCSGIDLLKQIDAHHYPAPILIISGLGDIPTALDAVRNGALDFIEKPFEPAAVVARVSDAIRGWHNITADESLLAHDFAGRERLTARELEVLGRITQGASNKEAGRELGISPRTIEVHRARIMEKLGAKNAADLMRVVLGKGRGQRGKVTAFRH